MTRVLVVGASGSGKSGVAEALLAGRDDVTYVATGPAADDADPDWAARVARHTARRPTSWATVERPDLPALLRSAPGPLLVDALGTWLADVLDRSDGWGDAVPAEVSTACAALAQAWDAATADVVLVADEVGGGVVPSTPAGRRFRDLLGPLTTRLSATADRALLVVAGRVVELPPSFDALPSSNDVPEEA